ncbi:MAG: metal-dependent transcriptional regulator [Saprospiraceae bacterium]
MEQISQTEENYLKAIFKISESQETPVSTNAISKKIDISAASVTDMLKRLAKKDLINYKKHKGVTLSEQGDQIARHLIRKHRLWEVFLLEKLDFAWDEVHEMAEQLEHIQAPELVERLDTFLCYPKFDPHGDPIPDAEGNFAERQQRLLCEMNAGEQGVIVGVNEHSAEFLQYLDRMKLVLGTPIEILETFSYDESVKVKIDQQNEILLSKKVSQNLFVSKL